MTRISPDFGGGICGIRKFVSFVTRIELWAKVPGSEFVDSSRGGWGSSTTCRFWEDLLNTKKRYWVKSVSWRLVAVTVLAIVAYSVTGEWEQVTFITLLYHGIQIIIYYLHERVWERISWGQVKHPLATIPVNRELTPEDMDIVVKRLKEMGYVD